MHSALSREGLEPSGHFRHSDERVEPPAATSVSDGHALQMPLLPLAAYPGAHSAGVMSSSELFRLRQFLDCTFMDSKSHGKAHKYSEHMLLSIVQVVVYVPGSNVPSILCIQRLQLLNRHGVTRQHSQH